MGKAIAADSFAGITVDLLSSRRLVISDTLRRVLFNGLRFDWTQRYPSAAELGDALAGVRVVLS